jgi:hypothetical protein
MSGKPKKQGRPEGSHNRDYVQNIIVPSTCPTCGSTDWTEYEGRSELEFSGTDPRGRPYNLIVWRTCRCKACDQWRYDKSFEMKKDLE